MESDARLVAAAILLGIPIEGLLERSGILQYDGAATRDHANREALYLAMARKGRRVSRGFLDEFFDLAASALEFERANGWQRVRTIDWVMERMERRPEAVVLPVAGREAV